MGIVGFAGCPHQGQHRTVQRLGAAEPVRIDRMLEQPRGDLRCRSGLTGQALIVDGGMAR